MVDRVNGRFATPTHCPSGHEYAGGNVHITPRGYRTCRACERQRAARDRARLDPVTRSLYCVWTGMLERCANPNRPNYSRYGARGIAVCERWRDFKLFCQDVGPRPPGLSLDRIDNDGNYEPGNCRWATQRQQMSNSTSARIIEFNGRAMCIAEWARALGIGSTTLRMRLKHWPLARALTEGPHPTRAAIDAARQGADK